MKKNLYSLLLSDDVVRAVDEAAHLRGLSRSALVDSVLASYTGIVTPEMRVNEILAAVNDLMKTSASIVPFFEPHTASIQMKSSLEYKYRPTVRYEVELYGADSRDMGALAVICRTQSPQLIERLMTFFALWRSIERYYAGDKVGHELREGRFIRSIPLPERDCSAELIADRINDYVNLFDSLMKAYLGGMDERLVQSEYAARSDKYAGIIL